MRRNALEMVLCIHFSESLKLTEQQIYYYWRYGANYSKSKKQTVTKKCSKIAMILTTTNINSITPLNSTIQLNPGWILILINYEVVYYLDRKHEWGINENPHASTLQGLNGQNVTSNYRWDLRCQSVYSS